MTADDRTGNGADRGGTGAESDGDGESGADGHGGGNGESGADGHGRGDGHGCGDDRRLWLVDRRYGDENLVTLVYATTDGEGHLRKQLSHAMLRTRPVTAAVDVPADRIEPVPTADQRERFAAEAARIADRRDPDDEV